MSKICPGLSSTASALAILLSSALTAAPALAGSPQGSSDTAGERRSHHQAGPREKLEAWLEKRAARFRTEEYRNSTGLDQIEAALGYARIIGRKGGQGVTVAVVGGGIDDDGKDLRVIRRSESSSEAGVVDADTTGVAGVIAARRDGKGVHGVAYKADLIDLEGARISGIMAAAGYTSVDERKQLVGFPTAASNLLDFHADDPSLEADIIHIMSFSESPSRNTTVRPVDLALARGKIVVVGAGDASEPALTSPAFVIGATEGSRLMVAAVDGNNELSASSRPCGGNDAARDACLVAPGEGINSTTTGGGYDSFSSSDIAAAHVSGAAAVVKAAFPGVSSDDVTNRLLTTAEDLGDPGVDDVYGHGLLDLGAALDPVGELGVAKTASVDGGRTAIGGSVLEMGQGFTLNGNLSASLGEAVVFDDQGFPFRADLGGLAATRERPSGLSSFIGSGGERLTDGMIAPDGRTGFMLSREGKGEDMLYADPHHGAFASSGLGIDDRPDKPSAHFASEVRPGLRLFMNLNDSASTDTGIEAAVAQQGALLFQPEAFFSPETQLAGGSQTGGGATLTLTDGTTLTVSAFASEGEDGVEAAESSLQRVELAHALSDGVELRFGYGWLQERDGFVGSRSTGVFGETEARSGYFSAGLTAAVTDDVRLFGGYSRGSASLSGGGLLADWSKVETESFGGGLVVDGVVEDRDRLTVMIGQPMRVTDAEAELRLPVGRTEEGRVVTETRRVDLAPEGRELSLETSYRFALDDDSASLVTGAFARLNPGHDPEAEVDLGIGMRYQLQF